MTTRPPLGFLSEPRRRCFAAPPAVGFWPFFSFSGGRAAAHVPLQVTLFWWSGLIEHVEREAAAVDEDDAELVDLPRLDCRGLEHVTGACDARLRPGAAAAGRKTGDRGRCRRVLNAPILKVGKGG